MLSTISLGDRILAVRCLELDRDFQLADLARTYLLAQKLIDGPVSLQKSSGQALEPLIIDELPVELPDASWQCPCSCHCGNYECDECYEAIDTSTEEMEATLTESSQSAPDQPEPARTLLQLFPNETPLQDMSGIVLRSTCDGLEMLKIEHRETSYYLFWTEQKVQCQVLGQLTVKPVEPL